MRIDDTRDVLIVTNAALPESRFDDVDLSRSRFRNVNLTGASFRDVNMTGVRIEDADLTGMEIDGVPVAALFEAYRVCRERARDENGTAAAGKT